jgi:cytochrome P450
VEEAGLKEKADFEGDQKDLLGVLVRANRATDLRPDQRLTRPELLGQLTTFLVAGHETTAAAAAWLLYYLSLYPDIQARVYEEVKELDRKVASEGEGREGGRPTWREMAELPLLRACFFEASRLQPSLPVTHRDAVEDDVIPLSRREFSVTRGVGILLSSGLSIVQVADLILFLFLPFFVSIRFLGSWDDTFRHAISPPSER